MRSNDVPATVSLVVRPKLAGPRHTIDRLRSHDRLEAIARLRWAVRAMGEVDVSDWDDGALTDHLEELSATLCEIDAQVARMADAVRARGFRISEPRAA
ncbi:hypothetical protein Aab01nite_71540 [Paractinoplanes abujensis]|uniref:Uncharacterized protein n=1 Tax=Paractinoplanes abujensis TaxID=882441 RepID=A0A7W7CWP1_9ACTN|nr:hypothetical protein [Actinoplanes abujensis]MBB4694835.1 hypothetical protein [Actinoplanes abujensis]GID23564.1 hypothetical protein Aab01nite_71540 [Actinoplanes abujensis]